MRRIEDDVVRLALAGVEDEALARLHDILRLDRRRAWWALFRIADAQSPSPRRDASITLVAKAYIAKRCGALIGVPDERLAPFILACLTADAIEAPTQPLHPEQRDWLRIWLPGRLKRVVISLPS